MSGALAGLRARASEYADALGGAVLPGPTLSAAELLAVYNRQYWCRLFGVLQNEYPLTARLLGFWQFNEHAARFLAARAPTGQDIQDAADGFDEHLPATLPPSRAESEKASRASERLAKPLRRIRPGAWLLVVPLLAALPACDEGPETEGDCQGSQRPIVAGAPAVVATPSADTAVLGLTLATSSDAASMAVGRTELTDKDALHATTSSDSGATFGDAMVVAPPEDVELSALRLLMPDGAGVLAGAVAHSPDPDGAPSHACRSSTRPRARGRRSSRSST